MRLVGPLLRARRHVTYDDADVPTVEVASQRDLEALADDLRNACEMAPVKISAVFRGQTKEHSLPDRSALVRAGSAYTRKCAITAWCHRFTATTTGFLKTPRTSFVRCSLLDWSLYSDMVFGDPVSTPAGRKPYVPKQVPGDAQATMPVHAGHREVCARSRTGAVYRVAITDTGGAVLDEYVKLTGPDTTTCGETSSSNTTARRHRSWT